MKEHSFSEPCNAVGRHMGQYADLIFWHVEAASRECWRCGLSAVIPAAFSPFFNSSRGVSQFFNLRGSFDTLPAAFRASATSCTVSQYRSWQSRTSLSFLEVRLQILMDYGQ